MTNRAYQICTNCILDTNDDGDIRFDQNGVCNYCKEYELSSKKELHTSNDENNLNLLINKIKNTGKNKKYDCVIGISGGVDSTYLIYKAKQLGLRPIAVHLDNGWNSETAVRNIEHIVNKLNIDLYTYVIDWEEFKDMQLAYLKASVVDIEVLTDHAINASLHYVARKKGIKYIITGTNITTEGVLPAHWISNKRDWANIKHIHKKYGTIKVKTYPYISFIKWIRNDLLSGIQSIPLLNYMDYNKEKVQKIIEKELGWKDYGGKHFESIFTRFYQAYILPKKFNIDKRKAHYSTLICSGQMTRQEALEALKSDKITKELLIVDQLFVLKKLGITKEAFDTIMNLPIKSHTDFKSNEIFYKYYFFFKKTFLRFKHIFQTALAKILFVY